MADQNNPLKGFRPLDQKKDDQNALSHPSTGIPQNQFGSSSPAVNNPTPVIQPMATNPQNGILCQNCKSINLPGAKFCTYCGKPIISSNIDVKSQSMKYCPNCSKQSSIGSLFCTFCGHNFSNSTTQSQPLNPAPIPSSYTSHKQPTFSSLSLAGKEWRITAGVFAILAFICFFLPLLVIKINNPAQWLVGGPDKISFTMSSMQILSLSSPTINGLGGLGETTMDLYNEINIGKMISEYADTPTKVAIFLGRTAMLLLLGLSIVGLVLTYKNYTNHNVGLANGLTALGVIAVVILVISSLIINVGFKTGSEDIDILLNSVVKFSNGLGFWGMLIGFSGLGFASYMGRNRTK